MSGWQSGTGICLLIHRWLVLWVRSPLEATLFFASFEIPWCQFCTKMSEMSYLCYLGKTRISLKNNQYIFVLRTRKSSCVNARGILPTVYQVLHMLSYPGGYPIPGQGVPDPEYPFPDLVWGYPIPGYPHSGVGYPQEGNWNQSLGTPWKGHGTSGSIMGWDGATPPPLAPPPGVNWQTNWNYYLPHPSDAGGNTFVG